MQFNVKFKSETKLYNKKICFELHGINYCFFEDQLYNLSYETKKYQLALFQKLTCNIADGGK